MLLTMIGEAGWFIKTLALLFVYVLDTIAYQLVSVSYSIFVAVSQLNIFATEEGSLIYDTIVSRLYMVISLAMVFVFAYFLIMMIIDPDGGAGKSTSNLVKQTIISLIVIAVLPTVYNYMAIFQQHVLQENTIGTIILGGNGLSGTNAGKNISMIVFTAFYHPKGSTYATFLDEDGTMRDSETAIAECQANGAKVKVCTSYYNGLKEWMDDTEGIDLEAVTGRETLRHNVGEDDGMEYMWVLSTGCAIVVAYFFFSYAIDLGTRAVKLAFLQIISPVPLIMRVFPKSKKTFDTWFSEIKKTYIEVFIRVAVIFFIVLLCQYVPTFIGALWNANDTVEGGIVVKALATVALILGLLKFAKDAPDLFKTMFDTGGGLFSGLDLKPGMKRRIEENDYAMKGLSTGLGGAGGMIGNMIRNGYNAYKKNSSSGDTKKNVVAGFKAVGSGLASGPRGLVSGARQGYKNTPKNLNEMGNSYHDGMDAAHASASRAEQRRENSKLLQSIKEGYHDVADYDNWKDRGKALADSAVNHWKDDWSSVGRTIKDEASRAAGVGESKTTNEALETINKATSTISDFMKLAAKDAEMYDKALEDLKKKIIKGEDVSFGGQTYNLSNIGDLEKIFKASKIEKMAATISKKYSDGGATYMSTLKRTFDKELRNLNQETINKINDTVMNANIKTADGNSIKDIYQLLSNMSDVKNADAFSADRVSVISEVESILSGVAKNTVIKANADKKNGDGK